MIEIKYNNWGGVREESKVIEAIHDQWCRDNGYRITKRVVHRGKAAAQYGRKCDRNVSKKRQVTDSVYAAEKK
jgi:hypothetical protein